MIDKVKNLFNKNSNFYYPLKIFFCLFGILFCIFSYFSVVFKLENESINVYVLLNNVCLYNKNNTLTCINEFQFFTICNY